MANRQLIAGVDSSTQSVKVVIRDANTGELVRQGRASHPDGTEVEPKHWLHGLNTALTEAGGIADVEAISIAGQQKTDFGSRFEPMEPAPARQASVSRSHSRIFPHKIKRNMEI